LFKNTMKDPGRTHHSQPLHGADAAPAGSFAGSLATAKVLAIISAGARRRPEAQAGSGAPGNSRVGSAVTGRLLGLALASCISLSLHAATITWDGTPTTASPGAQDGAGFWGTPASNTNWWNGVANVVWNNANSDTAVFGSNTTAATTVTITNNVYAGGIILSNAGTAAYTIAGTGGLNSNLTLTGVSPVIRLAAHDITMGGVTEVFSASVVATGGVSVVASTTFTNGLVRFGNITNNIVGSLFVGTPGNATYGGTTALFCDMNTPNSADPYVSIANNLTNVTVYSNAMFRISNHNSGSPANVLWPKQITISGDGRNGLGGAWTVTGNVGDNFVANVVLAGSSTIDFNAGAANKVFTLYGTITGSGNLQLVSGNSTANRHTCVLTNASTYIGNTLVAGGTTLQLINGNDRLPTGTALTLGRSDAAVALWNAYGRLVLGNAPLAIRQTITGLASDPTIANCWVIGGNATNISTLTVNNTSDNIFAGRLGGSVAPDNQLALVKGGAGTLFLEGTNLCAGGYTVNSGILQFGDGATDNPISGPITNAATVVFNTVSSQTCPGAITGSGSVVQIGGGILTLSGANTYTGSTIVSNGTVILMDTKSGNGSIIVASGGALGITRTTATGIVAASSASCDSAVLNLNFNANSPNSTALLTVSGVFANNGGTTVNLQGLSGLALGSYPLIKYGSYQSNAFSSVILGPMPSGVTASIQNNPGNSSLDLVITALNAIKWTGATDNNWDSSTTNWQNLSTLVPQAYSDGQYLTFDDTATGPTAILVGGNPQPGSMTVSNNSKAYSFTGAGISGGASLIKRGTGTLTLAVNNNNSGGTTIQKGTIQVGDGTTDGNIASPVINNGALVFNVLNASTYSGISGTGAVTKANSGTLNLGANSYSGATVVQAGKVYLQNSGALGGTTNSATFQPGSELWVDAAGVSIPENLTIGGNGVDGTAGAFNASANASPSALWSGAINVTSNAVFTTPYNVAATLSGPLTSGSNTLEFRSDGLGGFAGYYLVSGNINGKSAMLSGQGGLLLAGTNSALTNVMVLTNVPAGSSPSLNAGLWVQNSLGLGTNCSVTMTNGGHIGDTGTQLGLDNNVTIPAGVSLRAYCPGDGAEGSGGYRCTLAVRTSTTNTWGGPINLVGADPSLGSVPLFIMYGGGSGTSGRMIVNGDITDTNGVCTLLVRGFGSGVLGGHINLGTNFFVVTDSAVWTVTSTGNTWGVTQCGGGGETLALGANNALCTTAPVWMHLNSPANTLDLSGYNQQVAGLFNDGAGSATIRNSSTNTDSTLKVLSNLGSNWLYGATLTAVGGAKALHLDVAGDTLTLNAAGNNYTGTTTVRSGATLALLASGNISASSAIDVQAGGTFDVSGTTSGGYTVPAVTTLKGNGTVVGNIAVSGSLAPGESVGVLSVSGNVTNNSGSTCVMEVDNTAHTNDLLSVTGTMTYGGTLLVTNISGAAYTNNQVLKLFNATGGYSGSFASIVIPGTSSYDASNLAVDGTIKVTALPSTPTTLNYAVVNGGTQLQFSWPASYTGWLLESQTNSLNTNNWHIVPGSSGVNSITVPVDQSVRSVFYRLAHP
jgi:autotransporter-associated beta strand protein